MLEKGFKLHQTLHGYSDGHRLIRASRALPPMVERTMLVLSDMSGGGMVQGFESYITGYPLNEIKSYALARTWYAPEMKRPGCVWTHSLLIENSALAHISDLASLMSLFIRPSADPQTWDRYETNVDLSPIFEAPTEGRSKLKTPPWLHLASKAIHALYGSPTQQIFLPTDKTGQIYEDVTLAIWTQQWARLRRSFSFCTGSMSDRKLPDRSFDFQIVPRSLVRDISLTTKNGKFIESSRSEPTEDSRWVVAGIQDLSENNVELRRFLRVFGAETLHGRADYVSLLELFLKANDDAYENQETLRGVIELVAGLYPSATEGLQTKASFFGGAVSKRGQIPNFLSTSSEALVLSELTRTKYSAAFDATKLMIDTRAAALLEREPETTTKILASILESSDLTSIGEQFVNGIFERIIGIESYRFSEHEFEVLLLLIHRHRLLGASANVWRTTPVQQRRILEALTRDVTLTAEEIGGIVTAMLHADSDAAIAKLSQEYPENTVDALVVWSKSVSIDDITKLSSNWLDVIARNSRLSMGGVTFRDAPPLSSVMLLVLALDPNSKVVLEKGSRMWIDLADKAPNLLHGNLLSRTSSFMLAIGFNNPDDDAIHLVEKSFSTVHAAAEQHWLAESDWLALSSQAPSSHSIPSWDKCGRLRNALVEHFMEFRWPQQSLLKCLEEPELLQKVVNQISERGDWFNSQKGYIQQIAQQVFTGRLKASLRQKRVLKPLT